MLRVLQLSAPTTLAGAERVMLNYLQHYDPNNFTVRVASFLNYQHLNNSFTIALEDLGIPHDKIRIGNTSLIRQIYETIRVIKRHDIDVLHTHGYCSDFIGLIAVNFVKIPIVSTVHGWTPISPKLRRYEMLDRFCLKRFDSIVCVSRRLHEEFNHLGISTERLVYLPNAVSLPVQILGQREEARQQLGVAAEEKIIIAIGRLSPEKGLDILLAAFARQFVSDRGVRLILVGDGSEMAELKLLASRLDIAEQVVFAGFSADVACYYAAADLFVMSSHTEGFPMALLEAMAWGLPVLASAVGGIPDIVHEGKDGCLVPPGNEEQLAAVMGNLLNDRELAARLGQIARQTITERFAADKWAIALEKVYTGVHDKRVRS